MAMNKSYLLCLLFLLPVAFAKYGLGGCPKQQLVQNFNIAQYLGDWYERVRVEGLPYESGECSGAHYELKADGKLRVLNSEVREDGQWHVAEGEAYCEGTSAQCHVRFSSFAPWGDYEVIDTDYTNYTVIYSCSDFVLFHREVGWVLTRDANFNFDSQLNYLISKSSLTKKDFHFTSHSACPDKTFA